MTWPAGVRSAGVAAGIKGGGALDLGVVVANDNVAWAGAFTRNAAAAACVHWCRDAVGDSARGIVVNSGNANACTGPAGDAAVVSTAESAAAALGCEPNEVLVASTGPIGVPLDATLIHRALPAALAKLSPDPSDFAQAIITTDSRTKIARSAVGPVVVGVAKGAAMVAPGMATMLAFLVTDAAVSSDDLHSVLTQVVDRTFNRISIDGCESTNDSVFCLATGTRPTSEAELYDGISAVCRGLAEDIATDAEGATKLLRVRISGAGDDAAAATLGRAVAASALWRAAVHGGDPNWGRVAAALGAAERGLDLTKLEVAIGPHVVFAHGAPTDARGATDAMSGDVVTVTCRVGGGIGEAEILSADLSPAYVALNAEGAT